jgi:hypothetical protein
MQLFVTCLEMYMYVFVPCAVYMFPNTADVGAPWSARQFVYSIVGQIGSNSAPLPFVVFLFFIPNIRVDYCVTF